MHPWAESRRTITCGRNCGESRSTAETGGNASELQNELPCFGTIFWLGLGTIARMKPGQKWRIPQGLSDGERWIRTPGPTEDAGRPRRCLSRSRRLSKQKNHYLICSAPTKVRNWCAADVETIRRNSALGRCGSVPSRGRRFADVRRMH
jgi:hypothetical protein